MKKNSVAPSPRPAPGPSASEQVSRLEQDLDDAAPAPLGQFNITFYYMIGEEEVAVPTKACEYVGDDGAVVKGEPPAPAIRRSGGDG